MTAITAPSAATTVRFFRLAELMSAGTSNALLHQLAYLLGHVLAREVGAKHLQEFALRVHEIGVGAVPDEVIVFSVLRHFVVDPVCLGHGGGLFLGPGQADDP